MGLALCVAACGSSGPASTASAAMARLVKTPALPLQGCTYMIDGKVLPDEVPGVKPTFPQSQPDAASDSAIASIRAHGGSAVVGSFLLPPGTELYSGPDVRQPPVGTVSSTDQFYVYEPVVWVDHSGKSWLASFLACGGPNLYWVSVDQVDSKGASGAGSVGSMLAEFREAPPYTQTGKGSLLPIKIDRTDPFVFDDPQVTFAIGRGQIIIS
ncbi:MAG TPA: hypothetical protein VN796_09235 [Acidimicrobiales bacterium]|nr:hypothetical protein [Acidimicrobiales bacterium]